ncbi:MAG: hypothetical protein IPJ16_06680 [Bacteroidales bacterium]|nr:hypothetical protein [Bacteroidales bacterium]
MGLRQLKQTIQEIAPSVWSDRIIKAVMKGVKRTKPDWTNFNKIIHLTPVEQQLIDNLLHS